MTPRWLLLLHQLPSKPDYLRVKIWRRLQRIGAVPIKSAVHVLPRSDQAAEHFQWLVREIGAAGGEASVCEAAFVDGLSDGQIETLFRTARESDYAAAAAEAEEALRDASDRAELEAAGSRVRRRLAEIAAIDFFGAPARRVAESVLARLDRRIAPPTRAPGAAGDPMRGHRGRTWITRKGVYVDRIASAWLIRRYLDPRARFRFVEEGAYRPSRTGAAGREVRFDMFEAEYTHEADRCTFEVLLARFGLDHPGLRALGEMVHDIDLRDGKFGRPETAGLERMIDGVARRHAGDAERLAQGALVLDTLYESLQAGVRP